jgi:hypothetical protein
MQNEDQNPTGQPAENNVNGQPPVPAPPPGALQGPVPAAPAARPPQLSISSALGTVETLTEEQQIQLIACEAVLETAAHSFVDVGLALAQIRDDGLFTEYDSFEDYCRKKWDYGINYANRIIAAAQLFKAFVTKSHRTKPERETQVRALIGLAPEQALAAWEKAVEKAGSRKITARLIKAAIREVVPPPPQPATPKAPSKAEHRRQLVQAVKDLLILAFQKAPHQAILEKATVIDGHVGVLFPKKRK